MRVIIAGSRDLYVGVDFIDFVVRKSGFNVTQVICGKAKGIDSLGEEWAKRLSIPVSEYPADWNKFGNRAGRLRNQEMALNADALIAIWDGVSRGTENMITIAHEMKLPVYIMTIAGMLIDKEGLTFAGHTHPFSHKAENLH